jgi:soluble lytic murein transglycosylase-like protein
MTEPRDPVADLLAIVERGGFVQGRQHPTLVAKLRWCLLGFVAGIVSTLWWAAAAAAQVPPAAEQYRRDLVRAAVAVWGLEAPVASLAAQIAQESGFRPGVSSHAGAGGLAQMMPRTADQLAAQFPALRPVNRFDPRWSLSAQSHLMRQLYESHTARDDCHRYQKALASYSQGPGWTRRAERLADDPSRWFGSVEHINPGKSAAAYRETFEYVRRILIVLTPRYVDAGWGRGMCEPFWRARS